MITSALSNKFQKINFFFRKLAEQSLSWCMSSNLFVSPVDNLAQLNKGSGQAAASEFPLSFW